MSQMELDEQRLLAARLGGCVDMVDARLMRSSFGLDHFPDPGQKLGWSLDITPRCATQADEISDGHFVVSCEFALRVNQGNEGDDGHVVFSLDCEFSALYVVGEGPTDGKPFTQAELDAFAASTGAFALYPYARAYVQDATARVGLPPLTLGVYRAPIKDPALASGEAASPKSKHSRSASSKKSAAKKTPAKKSSSIQKAPK